MVATDNVVDTSFVGILKLGDNLRYNAQIVYDLYRATESIGGTKLYKPKLVFNVALIEGAFFDFVRRVRRHTREFQFLDLETRKKIREINVKKKLYRFSDYISKFEDWQILGGISIYEEIAELGKLRNRVHIQNEHGSFEADDDKAFTRKRLQQSEKCAEFCLKYFSLNYPRPQDFVGGIVLPWKPHFDGHLRWTPTSS